MRRTLTWSLIAAIALPAGVCALQPNVAQPGQPPASVSKPDPAYVLGHTVKDIDGKDCDLAQFKGKVVLIVNVASDCGLTPQYAGLQSLFESKREQGFVILGFPSNDFKGQEPGDEASIKSGCMVKYKVTFPMMSKVGVLGEARHPLYKQLAAQPAPIGGDAPWNFTKYLVSREGKVVARFDPRTKPGDAALAKAIDEQLAATIGNPAASPSGK